MAPPQDDPRNPFESFRRSADEQMSFLMRSLTGQPPKGRQSKSLESSESDEDLPWIIRGMSEEARRRYRNVQREMNEYISGEENAAPDRPEMQPDGQRCPYRPADQEVSRRNQIPSSKSIRERAEEARCPAFSGSEPYMPYLDEQGFQADPTWPITYLITSSYSPLYLEKQDHFQEHGQKWRHAFEDLIALQSGTAMADRCSPQSERCTAHWIGSMMNRGLLSTSGIGQQWLGAMQASLRSIETPRGSPEHYQAALRLMRAQLRNEQLRQERKRIDDEEEEEEEEADDFMNAYDMDEDEEEPEGEEEEMTELDLFERLLGLKGPLSGKSFIQTMASQAFREESEKSTFGTQEAENGNPSIVSTLTTTERTTLPDGSVNTKMVLKKRFADGREESTETKHTTKDPQQPTLQQKLIEKPEIWKNERAEKATEAEKSKQKAKGWFWS